MHNFFFFFMKICIFFLKNKKKKGGGGAAHIGLKDGVWRLKQHCSKVLQLPQSLNTRVTLLPFAQPSELNVLKG